MKNSFKKALVLTLAGLGSMAALAGCNGSGPQKQKDAYGIDVDAEGAELMEALHVYLMDHHTTYINYGSVTSNYKKTDMDPSNTSKLLHFYSANQTTSYGTREHVWACANSNGLWEHDGEGSHDVDKSSYVGGGSDLFHVRPCESALNTWRGNAKFMEFQEGQTYYEYSDGGPYKTKGDKPTDGTYCTKVEPADQYKGDIARIFMYLYVHYSKIGDNSKYSAQQQDMLGTLRFTDVFGSNYNMYQCQQLMVKWNKLDPVSEQEKMRNNNVEAIQGNRNPFIDDPTYMARCFSIVED